MKLFTSSTEMLVGILNIINVQMFGCDIFMFSSCVVDDRGIFDVEENISVCLKIILIIKKNVK